MVENDIADDIRAAMAVDAGDAPEPAETVIEAVAEEVSPPSDDAQSEDGRKRGPDGKFIAKDAESAQDTTDQPSKEVADPASQPVTRAPSSWSPAAKAEFDKLPSPVQQAVAKREQEIDQGLRRKAEELKRYEPLEQVLAPRRDLWAAQGMDETQAIKTLLAAQDLLEKNPVQGLEYLAKAYGVNFAGQAQSPQPGQPAPAQAGQAPEIEQLRAQIAQLQQSVQYSQTAPLVSEVEAFFSDPANLYAENVRSDMARLLETGMASTLKDAYDKACRVRDDIWPLVQPAPSNGGMNGAERAMRAKQAAVSVTGTPSSAPALASSGSIEDDIRLAMQTASGRA